MKLIKALFMLMPFLFAGSVFADDHAVTEPKADETAKDVKDAASGDKPAEPAVEVKKDTATDTDDTDEEDDEDEEEEPMD